MNIVTYDNDTDFIYDNESLWANQKQVARLFNVDVRTINYHLKNIFESGELDENSVIRNFRITAQDGKNYDVMHYNLDVIISVGYRVNSRRATAFRIWATSILSQYIKDGYVINEAVLSQDPSKLNKLASDVRRLRASEISVFAKVRECFKIASSDYEPSAKEVRSFYALLQDKFHHAITGMTASKLIMDRANSNDDNMGLVTFKGVLPTKSEAHIGKNYLLNDELHRMYLLSEQFLLYAESSALMNKKLTMLDLHDYLDKLLAFNGYPVFDGYIDYTKDHAVRHVNREYGRYIHIQKLKMIGVDVDLVDYDLGIYDEYDEQINNISISKLKTHLQITD